jgi:hypothetical protein
MSTTLDQRVAAAIADDSITAVDLSTLLQEIDVAIPAAEEAIVAARAEALDPAIDASAAATAVMTAELVLDRLKALRPRLVARLNEVSAAEHQARWTADFGELKEEQDALAEELRQFYEPVVAKFIDLFDRIKEHEERRGELNNRRPRNCALQLRDVELVARDIDAYTGDHETSVARLATVVRLPKWKADSPCWPRWTPSLGQVMAQRMMPAPFHPGANWAAHRAAQDAERREENRRLEASYAEQERLQRERRDAEDKAKAEEMRRSRKASFG